MNGSNGGPSEPKTGFWKTSRHVAADRVKAASRTFFRPNVASHLFGPVAQQSVELGARQAAVFRRHAPQAFHEAAELIETDREVRGIAASEISHR